MKNLKRFRFPRNLISNVLTLVVFISLGIYVYRNREMFASLANFSLLDLLIQIGIYFIFIVALGTLNQLIIQRLEPRITMTEIISLQFVNNLFNKIMPKGGVAFRAVYFKQRYQLTYAFFLVSFAGLVLISLASQALISLAAMWGVYFRGGTFNLPLVAVFVAILLGAFGIMLLRVQLPGGDNWLLKNIRLMMKGWQLVVKKPTDLLALTGVSVVILLIDAMNMFVIFHALGMVIPFAEAVILSSLSQIFSYINITPDGLGIREGVYLYLASIFSITEPQIMLGSLAQRAVSLVAALIFGGIAYLVLNQKRKTPLAE